MKKITIMTGLAMLLALLSCKKENENPPLIASEFTDGVFVANEGPFNSGTGTISFIKRDGSDVYHKVYQQANNLVPLGNIVQSIEIIDDLAYIAVNNADRVELVTTKSFLSVASIENIPTPAYIRYAAGDKVYVTSWDDKVYIIQKDGSGITEQISVGPGPTRMEKIGDEIWVLNQGGFGIGNTISVINTASDQVTQTLEVYPKPAGIATENDNAVWVLCQGIDYWQGSASEAHLIAVDPSSFSITTDIAFPDTLNKPDNLLIDKYGDYLFYTYPGGIYRYEIGNNELASAPFITHVGAFYALAYDAKEEVLYASDPVDYVQDGWIYRFHSQTGELIDSIHAGIVPRDFEFVD